MGSWRESECGDMRDSERESKCGDVRDSKREIWNAWRKGLGSTL